ncbi:hypothetical protein AB0H92_10810 [Streptomyces phaeochromogenes]|uniref:hypothetical protein n=1 Tax=Streptomyces phaeochromogenes TaxID=1923 RepID=UPI0034112AC2
MTAPLEITGPEDRDLFRFRKPSKTALALFGLTAVESAHLAGVAPEGPVTGAVVLAAAGALLLKGCVYRR